mmetsp:Transcript_13839/g.22930  ORF Transcript_13839/g.22930 Transcript_13839/m.22930 type:complete len:252 (+) Transcript_13839:144-899(+)|eukprot:CAMPEP_0114426340 /NCGR_PEP_ID=MMETSP0103-20121206/7743_1 /TAXON_ID=37642 ORGANISM="Paraphysomonas imperforata, Strain PA2" /NCGR_SAMPLE_ID=MMETSP0103 /ASSEMBLY_ACC=CAM_ASM_000201 /LENGTH=251 /DNA_ID=CAMNT_0001595289 /DNA_START=148 /DNA_END=903 /DNA_ORIENTATION=+
MGNYSSRDVTQANSNSHAIPQRVEQHSIPVASGTSSQHATQMPATINVTDVDANSFGADDDFVPAVFRWEHGGRNVYITGTFNNWDKQIPMHRSGNDFTYIHNVKRGRHAFKFVVDDEWRFAPDQPTVADIEGRINNFIDVSEFHPYMGDNGFFEKSKERKIPEAEFGQVIPDIDEYTKEPPVLPPHLRHIILNKPSSSVDALALPVPQPVSLNHLYCTAIKDGMMVLGVTERYKKKFITQVFYSTMPGPS